MQVQGHFLGCCGDSHTFPCTPCVIWCITRCHLAWMQSAVHTMGFPSSPTNKPLAHSLCWLLFMRSMNIASHNYKLLSSYNSHEKSMGEIWVRGVPAHGSGDVDKGFSTPHSLEWALPREANLTAAWMPQKQIGQSWQLWTIGSHTPRMAISCHFDRNPALFGGIYLSGQVFLCIRESNLSFQNCVYVYCFFCIQQLLLS